jgi:hypothetical protein
VPDAENRLAAASIAGRVNRDDAAEAADISGKDRISARVPGHRSGCFRRRLFRLRSNAAFGTFERPADSDRGNLATRYSSSARIGKPDLEKAVVITLDDLSVMNGHNYAASICRRHSAAASSEISVREPTRMVRGAVPAFKSL